MTAARPNPRGRKILAVMLGVGLGAAAPMFPACREPCDLGPQPLPDPAYGFLDTGEAEPDWVLTSGRVEVSEDRLVISYETTDGTQWQVVYLAVADD